MQRLRHGITQNGFTLIELSIVLVIIGLVVGGILVGRDLVEAAEIRATVSQYIQYKTAVNTFKLKYQAMPGDMIEARAAALGFQPTSRPGDITLRVVHGNEWLEIDSTPANSVLPALAYEFILFWRDLSSASLIGNGFDSATDAYAATVTMSTLDRYLPRAKLGANYWMAYSVRVGDTFWNRSYAPGNYLQLVGISGIGGAGWVNLAGRLTPSQAQNIDAKIDDGAPMSGAVLLSEDTVLRPNSANVAPPRLCVLYSGGTVIQGYLLSSSTPACQLSLRLN